MSERNGPGGMNTERRSPIITSGVATPSVASSNIAVVITVPAINPANKPAKIALVLLTALVDPTEYAPQGNQIAGSAKNEIAHQNLTTCLPRAFSSNSRHRESIDELSITERILAKRAFDLESNFTIERDCLLV